MKKGIFVKGFAVVLTASMLTGCGALSAEEYKEAVEDAMEDYQDAMSDLTTMLYEDEDDIDKGDAKEAVEEAKAALKSIKSLSAPKEIKDEHKEFCEGLDIMIKMTDLSYDAVLAYIDEDEDKMEDLQDEVMELQEDAEEYTEVLSEIGEKIDELIEEEEDD
ncbi:MAG: hypothetical protein E7478_06085 [Ruminococcaceae bacterium]|nr:hypothetical protein [Oscillospiraceae bacterium]